MIDVLESRLLDAHARDDRRGLVDLYQKAGEQAEDHDARCFFLTHAYIFALETAHPAAPALRAILKAAGREA